MACCLVVLSFRVKIFRGRLRKNANAANGNWILRKPLMVCVLSAQGGSGFFREFTEV